MASRLLLTVKELRDIQRNKLQLLLEIAVYGLVLLIADAASDDRIHLREVGRHEGRRHLRVVRIGLDHPVGGPGAVFGGLHIVIIVGNGQPLVLRPRLHDLQHAVDGIPGFIKAQSPESCDDQDAVVGPGHLKSFLPAPDRLVKILKDFGRDPVHRIHIADASPCGDRAFHRRKPQEIVVADRFKDRQEGFRTSAVCIFTDRLACALLKLCGQKELREQLMELRIPGLYDSPDERHRDDRRVVVT